MLLRRNFMEHIVSSDRGLFHQPPSRKMSFAALSLQNSSYVYNLTLIDFYLFDFIDGFDSWLYTGVIYYRIRHGLMLPKNCCLLLFSS